MAILLPLTTIALAAAPATSAADFDFTYKYPAAAARIAPLKAWLEADRARLRARFAHMAAVAKADAAKSGFPYRRYQAMRTWKVVTETPRFLSLSLDSYDFTGGAHGNPSTGTLVWDKVTARRVRPTALFRSPAAIQAALGGTFCKKLDAERAKRRGAPVVPEANDPATQCPAVKETVMLLGSTDGRRIDRIGLVANPYLAGPYVEGTYDITVPVTPGVLAAVKPAYRAAFAAR